MFSQVKILKLNNFYEQALSFSDNSWLFFNLEKETAVTQ